MLKMHKRFDLSRDFYRNVERNKLNMALVSGNNRIYGAESEGGITHEHPIEQPWSHIQMEKKPELEAFVIKCLWYLKDRNIA